LIVFYANDRLLVRLTSGQGVNRTIFDAKN